MPVETRSRKQANLRSTSTPAAQGGSQQPGDPEPPPTHILSLPNELLTSHILPGVSSSAACGAFLGACKATHSLNSNSLRLEWLQQQHPADALQLATTCKSRSETLFMQLLARPGMLEACTAAEEEEAGEEVDPLLLWAVEAGYTKGVRRLLRLGRDPGAAGKGGFTPLMGAAWHGCVREAKMLLDAGADAGQANKGGYNALHEAARQGKAQIVRLLLEDGGVDARVRNGHGHTPLECARRAPPNKRSGEVVALLEEHEKHLEPIFCECCGSPLWP